jgi:predicted dehydrogenase
MTVLATDAPEEITAEAPAPRLLRPVRVAVVGLDRPGIAHAAVLASIPDAELVGVMDDRAEARRHTRGLGYSAPSFDRVEKLLSRATPDAVVVCGPLDRRAAVARAALEARAAVLVETPFARSAAEAAELVRAAGDQGTPLASAHSLLYRPVFARAHRVIVSRALGPIRQVRTSLYLSRVFGAPQKRQMVPAGSPGGVVLLAATDLLFLLVATLGMPVEVRATRQNLYGTPEDELHAMMRLEAGADVGFDTSWSVPGYPAAAVVLELEGDNGKLLASDDALELDLREARAGIAAGHTRLGPADLPRTARFDLEGDALYLLDASFLAWVSGGSAIAPRAERALQVARLVEALYASAEQDGKPVPVER